MKLGEVCEHGSLKRQCALCDLIAERDAIKAENERLRKALEKIETSDQYVDKLAIAIEALSVSKANTPTQGGEGDGK